MGRTFFFVGAGKLAKKLEDLTTNETKAVIRGGCRDALKPIQRQAKQDAPKDKGGLIREIKIRSLKRSRRRVGARVTIKSHVGKSRYSFVVLGKRKLLKGFRKLLSLVGVRVNEGFLEKAARERKRESVRIFADVVDKHIKKVMGKRK
jgi:hypothetical protein